MAALTVEKWIEVRADWEAGLSLDKCAAKHGVSVTTLRKHKDNEGWARVGTEIPDVVAAEALPEVMAATSDTETVTRLLAALAAREAELAALQSERDALAKDVKLDLPTTTDEVIAFYTRPYLEQVALDKFNKARRSRGFNPVELQSGDPVLEKEVQKIAQTFLERRTKWAGEPTIRTMKMAKPNPDSPTGWSIKAIPMENRINNFVAAREEAIARYTRKGFKLIVPQLCYRGSCNAVAAVKNGRLKFQGFCSEQHMMLDDTVNANLKKGVTTTAVSFTSGAPLTASVSGGFGV